MAVRKILTIEKDLDILRKVSKNVTAFDARLNALLDDMAETMKKAEGVGLAAIQVGILKRVAIIDTEESGFLEMINTKITFMSEESEIMSEGCLSIPDECDKVKRPIKITVEAYDRNNKVYSVDLEGFAARAACHEIDHMDGILYIDKVINEEN